MNYCETPQCEPRYDHVIAGIKVKLIVKAEDLKAVIRTAFSYRTKGSISLCRTYRIGSENETIMRKLKGSGMLDYKN